MSSPDSKNIKLAERLRVAREQAGLSQGQVAKMLNLHRPSISELEAGRRKVSAEELTKMAQIYGVSIAWLTDSDVQDIAQDRIELAARELARMKQKDFERLMDLLSTLRKTSTDEEG